MSVPARPRAPHFVTDATNGRRTRAGRPSIKTQARPAAVRTGDTARAVDGVRRLVRGLRLAEQRTRLEAGLSAAQLFVLTELSRAPSASLGELGQRTMTDRSSVAAVVERLEEAGLVSTRRSGDDRRRVLVRLTAAGRRRLAAAPPPPTVLLVSALERLSPQVLRGLTVHLGALVTAMGLADEPATMLFEEPVRRP
jgi:DNA-binding MarR family transcriptional regulator